MLAKLQNKVLGINKYFVEGRGEVSLSARNKTLSAKKAALQPNLLFGTPFRFVDSEDTDLNFEAAVSFSDSAPISFKSTGLSLEVEIVVPSRHSPEAKKEEKEWKERKEGRLQALVKAASQPTYKESALKMLQGRLLGELQSQVEVDIKKLRLMLKHGSCQPVEVSCAEAGVKIDATGKVSITACELKVDFPGSRSQAGDGPSDLAPFLQNLNLKASLKGPAADGAEEGSNCKTWHLATDTASGGVRVSVSTSTISTFRKYLDAYLSAEAAGVHLMAMEAEEKGVCTDVPMPNEYLELLMAKDSNQELRRRWIEAVAPVEWLSKCQILGIKRKPELKKILESKGASSSDDDGLFVLGMFEDAVEEDSKQRLNVTVPALTLVFHGSEGISAPKLQAVMGQLDLQVEATLRGGSVKLDEQVVPVRQVSVESSLEKLKWELLPAAGPPIDLIVFESSVASATSPGASPSPSPSDDAQRVGSFQSVTSEPNRRKALSLCTGANWSDEVCSFAQPEDASLRLFLAPLEFRLREADVQSTLALLAHMAKEVVRQEKVEVIRSDSVSGAKVALQANGQIEEWSKDGVRRTGSWVAKGQELEISWRVHTGAEAAEVERFTTGNSGWSFHPTGSDVGRNAVQLVTPAGWWRALFSRKDAVEALLDPKDAGEASPSGDASAPASAAATPQSQHVCQVTLDLDLSAPVVRWGLSDASFDSSRVRRQHQELLIFRFGRVRLRTVSSFAEVAEPTRGFAGTIAALPDVESVASDRFGVDCLFEEAGILLADVSASGGCNAAVQGDSQRYALQIGQIRLQSEYLDGACSVKIRGKEVEWALHTEVSLRLGHLISGISRLQEAASTSLKEILTIANRTSEQCGSEVQDGATADKADAKAMAPGSGEDVKKFITTASEERAASTEEQSQRGPETALEAAALFLPEEPKGIASTVNVSIQLYAARLLLVDPEARFCAPSRTRGDHFSCFELKTVSGKLSQFKDGDKATRIATELSLGSLSLKLHGGEVTSPGASAGRQLLAAPRSTNLQDCLFRTRQVFALGADAQNEPIQVGAVFAQVAVLYRQYDVDHLTHFATKMMLEFNKATQLSSAAAAAEVKKAAWDRGSGDKWSQAQSVAAKVSCWIGAPKVYMATDPRARKGTLVPVEGTTASAWGQDASGGTLAVNKDTQEWDFQKSTDEELLVLDLGYVTFQWPSRSGSDPSTMAISLHNLGLQSEAKQALERRSLLQTTSRQASTIAVVCMLTLPKDAAANVDAKMLPSSGDRINLVLTRGEVTRLLDVVAENVAYTSLAGLAQQRSATASLPVDRAQQSTSTDNIQPSLGRAYTRGSARRNTPTAEEVSRLPSPSGSREPASTPSQPSSMKVEFSSPATLALAVAFSETAPVADLVVKGTSMTMNAGELQVRCDEIVVEDTRTTSRNRDKRLLYSRELELVQRPQEVEVSMHSPEVQLLPQLAMDLMTWANSSWLQSTYNTAATSAQERRMGAPATTRPSQSTAGADQVVSMTIKARLENAAFRIPVKWHAEQDYFKFCGNFGADVELTAAGVTRLKELLLAEAYLKRAADHEEATLTHGSFELRAEGSLASKAMADNMSHTEFTIDRLFIRPFQLRLSTRDVRKLADCFSELARMDCTTVEPPEEGLLREPRMNELQSAMDVHVVASVGEAEAIAQAVDAGKIELHVLDMEDARTVLEVQIAMPLMVLDLMRSGSSSSMQAKMFDFGCCITSLSSRSEKSAMEPLMKCELDTLSYETKLMQGAVSSTLAVKVDEERDDRVGDVKHRLNFVLTSDFLSLARRLSKEIASTEEAGGSGYRYGGMLTATNVTGVNCRLSTPSAHQDIGEGTVVSDALCGSNLKDLELKVVSGEHSPQVQHPEPTLKLPTLQAQAQDAAWGRSWPLPAEGWELAVQFCMPHPPRHELLLTFPVCIVNNTDLRLQVRFQDPSGNTLQPERKIFATHSSAIRAKTTSSFEVQSDASEFKVVPAEVVAGTVVRLSARSMVSLPWAMAGGHRIAKVQVRPEIESGKDFSWSAAFDIQADGAAEELVKCFRSDCPAQALEYAQMCCMYLASQREVHRCSVHIDAPLILKNALPCPIACLFNAGTHTEHLRTLTVSLGSRFKVARIFDGFGGHIDVHPNSEGFEHRPVCLSPAALLWYEVGRRRQSAVLHGRTNSVSMSRQGRYLTVECFRAAVDTNSGATPTTLAPQEVCTRFDTDMLPVFTVKLLSPAAAEGGNMRAGSHCEGMRESEWSLPVRIRASQQGGGSSLEIPVEIPESAGLGGARFTLVARCSKSREVVIFARHLFLDGTGPERTAALAVRHAHGRSAGIVPLLGRGVEILPEVTAIAAGDRQFDASNLQRRISLCATMAAVGEVGSIECGQVVEESVPAVGTFTEVTLAKGLHCVVRADQMAAAETLGGASSLVTLVPAVVACNLSEVEVGLASPDVADQGIVWFGARAAAGAEPQTLPLWNVKEQERKLQVVLKRKDAAAGSSSIVRSAPFPADRSDAGSAWPLRIDDPADPSWSHLLCVRIDEEIGTTVVTIVGGDDHCHTLENAHPRLSVCLAGGSPCWQKFGQTPLSFGLPTCKQQVALRLRSENVGSSEELTVDLDLGEAGVKEVWGRCGCIVSLIEVSTRDRVAAVVVKPKPGSGSSAASTSRAELELRSFCVALVGYANPKSRVEVGSLALDKVKMDLLWQDGSEEANLKVAGCQIDVTPLASELDSSSGSRVQDTMVMLASLQRRWRLGNRLGSAPLFLDLRCKRNCQSHWLKVPTCGVALGPAEVSITVPVIQAILSFLEEIAGPMGLPLKAVEEKSGKLQVTVPPASQQRLHIDKLELGALDLGVWCNIHLPDAWFMPDAARVAIQVTALGTETLIVQGARVYVRTQQIPAEGGGPLIGSFGSVLDTVCKAYLPRLMRSLPSILANSNLALAGLVGVQWWSKLFGCERRQRVQHRRAPICRVDENGAVVECTQDQLALDVAQSFDDDGPRDAPRRRCCCFRRRRSIQLGRSRSRSMGEPLLAG